MISNAEFNQSSSQTLTFVRSCNTRQEIRAETESEANPSGKNRRRLKWRTQSCDLNYPVQSNGLCLCICPLKKTQAGPEESGIKTLRPLLTALQRGEPPGLWSGSLKLRSAGFGLHPSRLHSTQITIYYPPICTPAPAIGERSRRGEGAELRGEEKSTEGNI